MENINIQKMKEIIQSSHLNFLIGAGLSFPFLPLLSDIETRLSAEKDDGKKIVIYKEYFKNIILPNTDIIKETVDKNEGSDYRKTYNGYRTFFELINSLLLKRKSTILSKQTNIFTANVDIMMETVLEDSNLNYNAGFSGQMNPVFSLSNFKKSIRKRSLHFENISEMPVFNLVKMHGSLTWKLDGKKIVFSKLDHIDNALLEKNGEDFKRKYKEILIVNPEPEKLEKTVIDITYYELLRMYAAELEKENAVLFILGFSMEDEHIREITVRSANSNPTLKIYIFCHSKDNLARMKENIQYDKLKYSNVEVIIPKDALPENKLTLEKINKEVFGSILYQIEGGTVNE